MTRTQKIIKAVAVVFAILLIIAIFSAIFKLGAVMIGISSISEYLNDRSPGEMTKLDVSEAKKLSLDLESINLIIRKGESFSASSDSKYVKVTNNKNGTLSIKEDDGFDLFSLNSTAENLIIEVPDGFIFDEFDLDAGAGIIEISALSAKEIDFELGAGEVKISNLNVTGSADIDGGAGKITLEGSINTLDMEMGVGELNLKTDLKGKSSIDFGVGNANVTLLGTSNDYDLSISKGIGSVTVDGKSAGEYKSSSDNNAVRVTLNCGVGNVNVKFE